MPMVSNHDPVVRAMTNAIKRNDPAALEQLLKDGADPNSKDLDRIPTLHHATDSGNPALIRLLVAAGADINATASTTVNESPALHWAIKNNDIESINCLIQLGADVSAVDRRGQTGLHVASYKSDTSSGEIITTLLDHGTPIDKQDNKGYTALHRMAIQDRRTAVLILLQRGANPHLCSERNLTALHWAVQFGRREIIEALLRAGSDVNTKDNTGRGVLHSLAGFLQPEERQLATMRLLIEHGAKIDGRDQKGVDVVIGALAASSVAMAKTLIADHGAPIPEAAELNAALLRAAYHGQTDVVRVAIDWGADPYVSDNGRSLLQLAGRNEEIKRMIRAARTQKKLAAIDEEAVATPAVAPATKRTGFSPL